MDRDTAVSLGLTKYQPDYPCKHGHMAERYVSNNGCIECINPKLSVIVKNSPEEIKVIDANYNFVKTSLESEFNLEVNKLRADLKLKLDKALSDKTEAIRVYNESRRVVNDRSEFLQERFEYERLLQAQKDARKAQAENEKIERELAVSNLKTLCETIPVDKAEQYSRIVLERTLPKNPFLKFKDIVKGTVRGHDLRRIYKVFPEDLPDLIAIAESYFKPAEIIPQPTSFGPVSIDWRNAPLT